MKNPVFYLKTGELSAYALACGYIDVVKRGIFVKSRYGDCPRYELSLERGIGQCYFIYLRDYLKDDVTDFSFTHLKEARSKFRKLVSFINK